MIYLPDVNVWLALTSTRYVDHKLAKYWITGVVSDNIAFCRITELGLLRLLTNPAVMGTEIFSAVEAWQAYDDLRADSRVVFSAENRGFSARWRAISETIRGGDNAWTDMYLAVLALNLGASVVTFDHGFPDLPGGTLTRLDPRFI
jgi:toxin-antitoxin system PIN domain toxin